MNTIELTLEEQEVLHQLLNRELRTMEVEIRHTDHAEFKEVLKHRRHLLHELREKVQGSSALTARD